MEPTSLQEAVLYFSNPSNCREYLVARRWPNGVECPYCGSKNVKFSEKYNRWQCGSHHKAEEGKKALPRQFTLKTGTIFEESPIGLDKWLLAMWQIINCKNGVSSYEIAKAIRVTQKSAWFMLHRLREVMEGPKADKKLKGEIEADETFVGGKVANMHADKQAKHRAGKKRIGGFQGKTVVMGLLERHGEARVKVLPNTRKHHVRGNILENVKRGSTVYTDALRSYENLEDFDYIHEFIDHTEAYVRDQVHTNGLENFWSLLKRGLKGTYISVEPAHLQAYVNEQVFRFNNRKDMNDAERFSLAVSQIVGKRLTWDALVEKQPIERPE